MKTFPKRRDKHRIFLIGVSLHEARRRYRGRPSLQKFRITSRLERFRFSAAFDSELVLFPRDDGVTFCWRT